MLDGIVIVDDSLMLQPSVAAGATLWDQLIPYDIEIGFPAMSLGLTPSVAASITTTLAMPSISLVGTVGSPAVVSVGRTSTSERSANNIRVPNPYSQKEVRKAIEQIKHIASYTVDDSTTVDEDLSTLQSAVTALDERVDALEDISSSETSSETDDTVAIGQPIYIKGTGHAGLAKADAASTMRVAGLAIAAALPTFSCTYATDGKLTKADWTAVIGSASLTPGADYYLSTATAGKLTTTAPSAVGQYVVRVGNALSATVLAIEIEPSLLL